MSLSISSEILQSVTCAYAKVVDEKKNKAANAIQIDIENDKT